MYNATPGLATGSLAATGTGSLWLGLAAFTLVTAGCALMRLVPRGAR
ncbi:hypothetical protein ACGFX4_23600 [Kitasatospora sp. NPDC048365]